MSIKQKPGKVYRRVLLTIRVLLSNRVLLTLFSQLTFNLPFSFPVTFTCSKLFPSAILYICTSATERCFTAIISLCVSPCSMTLCCSTKLPRKVPSDRACTVRKRTKNILYFNYFNILKFYVSYFLRNIKKIVRQFLLG